MFDSKFIHVYDLQYEEGRHYFDASRRTADEIAAVKTDEEFRKMVPDAVSCFVIIVLPDKEPRLLLTEEFRYPAGRFLLSVPAGLIDPGDRGNGIPALTAAAREIEEETGLKISEGDSLKLVNPLVFSTPGMSDESNALACAVINRGDSASLEAQLSQKGASGSELFDGFLFMTKEQAGKAIRDGADGRGIYYSVYTWMGMMYFISDMWKE